jgi:hypothetical protein
VRQGTAAWIFLHGFDFTFLLYNIVSQTKPKENASGTYRITKNERKFLPERGGVKITAGK